MKGLRAVRTGQRTRPGVVSRRPRLGIWGRLMRGLEGPLWLGGAGRPCRDGGCRWGPGATYSGVSGEGSGGRVQERALSSSRLAERPRNDGLGREPRGQRVTREQSGGGQGSACLPRQLGGGRRQGGTQEQGEGGSAGSPREHGARSGGSRGQVQDHGPGVRLLEGEHFRVLKGGDERDWH